MGKSHFIRAHATARDLIVVSALRRADHLYRYSKATIASARTIEKLTKRGYDTVYVDDAEFVFREIDRRRLIYLLAGDHDTTFVFLG